MKIPKAWTDAGGPVSLTAFQIKTGYEPKELKAKPLAQKLEARGSRLIESPGSLHKIEAEGDVARWWSEMSEGAKEEYVAEHPNSKYADMHRESKKNGDLKKPDMGDSGSHEGGEHEGPTKKVPQHNPTQKPHGPGHKGHAPAPKKPSEHKPASSEHEKVGTPDIESTRKLLSTPEYAPGSTKRKAIGSFLKKKTSHVISHLKHDAHEWKTAGLAMKKLATGKPLEHGDKHAMGAVAADLAAVTASLLLTGGAAHGIIAFVHHFGSHLAQEALIKAAVKGAAGAAQHASLRILSSETDEDRMMTEAVKYMMDALENGDLQEMMARFEAEAKKEHKDREAKKDLKASSEVSAALDMGPTGLGAGKCPDCKSPMIVALIANDVPGYACPNSCRISLPLPDNHDYFRNGEKEDQIG